MRKATTLRDYGGERRPIPDPPDTPRHRNKGKNTRKWCKGKVGVPHKYETKPYGELHYHNTDHAEAFKDWKVQVCSGCGRHGGLTYPKREIPWLKQITP